MKACTSGSFAGRKLASGRAIRRPGSRSRGGLSTKIHLLLKGQAEPIALRLTADQAGEFAEALPLLAGRQAEIVMADRGYTPTPSSPPSRRSEQKQ